MAKVTVTQSGIYVESERELLRVRQSGIYVETERELLRVRQSGIYVEVDEPFPFNPFGPSIQVV